MDVAARKARGVVLPVTWLLLAGLWFALLVAVLLFVLWYAEPRG